MNNKRRKKLQIIIEDLANIRCRIEDIGEEEQDAYDNLSDGLQCSSKGEVLQENADLLSDIADQIDEIVETLNGI